jgi:hypothetical protein
MSRRVPYWRTPTNGLRETDNPPTDGQSHAGALFFGGEEGIEYAIDFSHRKAEA